LIAGKKTSERWPFESWTVRLSDVYCIGFEMVLAEDLARSANGKSFKRNKAG
jgi:hypothetical protein